MNLLKKLNKEKQTLKCKKKRFLKKNDFKKEIRKKMFE